jgi:signal transduction histidine kinase
MHGKRSPWILTLATAVALAVVVAGSSVLASRYVESLVTRPPGNRVDDAFHSMVQRVTSLEGLWQKALEEDSLTLLSTGGGSLTARTTGVVQQSYLRPNFFDPARAHVRLDGRELTVRPVLERNIRGEPGEWPLREEDVVTADGWLEEPGRPMAWVKGNGRMAVVLLLDPAAAALLAEKEMKTAAAHWRLDGEPGGLVWYAPNDRVWLESGRSAGQPQEVMRHVSRFGDWTLRYYYPAREVVHYRTPVLAGGFGLAVLLLSGGFSVARGQRRALKAAEERVSFVNRVSHELRTPLTNLLLNTDLALDGLEGTESKVRRRLGLIREETGRLSRIVDNVLAFARIERGGQASVVAACDVDGLIAQVEENFAPLFLRKSIVCTREVFLPPLIEVDGDALAQIIANLLSNVEKYSGEGARASLTARMEERMLVVEVIDDGPGISVSERERIFQPFERALTRVDEGATGTGLGLAISRELAGRMGGCLELRFSALGARFGLEVPATIPKGGGS